MKIGNIDLDEEVLIIAEIGNNHEGNYALAEQLISLAAKAGAGAVKFQVIIPDRLSTIKCKSRIQQLKKFQLSYEEFEKLSRVAKQEDILFLATAFDIESAHLLEPLVPAFKISSGDNNFFPLIDVIARTGKPILMSAGLADMEQISTTKAFIERIWRECGIVQEMAILHCVTSYPTALNEANLLAIRTLSEQLGVTAGYSDHTLGIEAAVLSVALGARIVEKHFTIHKNYSDFRDHRLSADPEEFTKMVKKIKDAIKMLGDGDISIQESEKAIMNDVRRSITASRNLEKGAVISWEDLAWVRPGNGLSPGMETKILGKVLSREIMKGEIISLGDFSDSD